MIRNRALAALAALGVVAALAPGASAATTPTIVPVVEGLGFVTQVVAAPDGTLFLADKDSGEIRIARDGVLLETPFATLPVMLTAVETGLLGLALHPDFPDEPWVYAYYSSQTGRNVLVRMRAEGDVGGAPEVLLEGLPTSRGYHNGGEVLFGADGMLYVMLGEMHDGPLAQDPTSLGGKILRLAPDGSVPDDNPTPGSPIFSSGHRNSFGMCVDPVSGDLWETENGPDRDDEINRIRAGANYGWPDVTGAPGTAGYVDAEVTFAEVIAPTGCAISADGSHLFFGDYGGRLHRVSIGGETVSDDGVVATLDDGIVDVLRTDDGSLLVAAGGTVYRVSDLEGSPAMPQPSPGGGIFGILMIVALAGALLWQVDRLRRVRVGR